jgi:hypothetical protein
MKPLVEKAEESIKQSESSTGGGILDFAKNFIIKKMG